MSGSKEVMLSYEGYHSFLSSYKPENFGNTTK